MIDTAKLTSMLPAKMRSRLDGWFEALEILLEVRASNVAALALYDRLGFTRFNVRERYYSDGEDGIEMVLALGGEPGRG